MLMYAKTRLRTAFALDFNSLPPGERTRITLNQLNKLRKPGSSNSGKVGFSVKSPKCGGPPRQLTYNHVSREVQIV
jgi:hypothetical protein